MNRLCAVLLLLIGLLNVYPAIGMASAEQVTSLYGIAVTSPDLEVLMRHRAVMLGLIGALMLYAAFTPQIQVLAATVGLASMASFVVIAYRVGEYGELIQRVVLADIAGSVVAFAVIGIRWRAKTRRRW